jgi:hypothetical protein
LWGSLCHHVKREASQLHPIYAPTGVRYILVNGAVTFESNECTGALPGKLLCSYDMID